MKPAPIRLIIADDHELFRIGVRHHLNSYPDIKIIAEAKNGLELCALADSLRPDIIISDINMPIMNGIEATKKILEKNNSIKILAMSFMDNELAVVEMLVAGASGYLSKDIEAGELGTAITSIQKGQPYFSIKSRPELVNLIAESNYEPSRLQSMVELSEREKEILSLICQELTSRQIGIELHISPRTAEKHILNIHQKLGVRCSIGVVIYAIRNGLYFIPAYTRSTPIQQRLEVLSGKHSATF